MGLRTDAKRKKRMNDSIDKEGLGLGFMSFLDDIENIAKVNVKEYKAPKDDYMFNKDEFEVAIGESDLEDMEAGPSNEDQENSD